MANNKIIILLFCSCICFSSSRFFQCSDSSEPPQTVDNLNYSFPQILYWGSPLTPVVISNQVLVNNNDNYKQSIKDYYKDSDYCPKDFKIPKKEELEAVINGLGDQAYSTFTNTDGLNMKENIYYITNKKVNGDYN